MSYTEFKEEINCEGDGGSWKCKEHRCRALVLRVSEL